MRPPDLDPLGTDKDDPDAARRLRRTWQAVQAGGIAFLAVALLGLLPTIIYAWFPALGPQAAVAVWIVAPAIPIALLVLAALRLPR